MSMIKAGVLGATGAVGQRFVEFLQNHPWFELSTLAASERSAGKPYAEATKWRLSTPLNREVSEMEVINVMDIKNIDADIVFSALPSDVAYAVELKYAEEGFVVASNASAHRMEDDVPLVIPEVNKEHLELIDIQKDKRKWNGCIVTNPNCSTIMMTMALKPLMRFGIRRVYVATMQAVSGAGYTGVPSMAILDNIIPFIAGEERKMETEPLKILGELENERIVNANISISASCHRVPVLDGHTEAIWVEFDDVVEPDDVMEKFESFDHGLQDLPTLPENSIMIHKDEDRPQPRLDRDLGRGMTVSVGRIRKSENGIKFIVLGHNTVRGAAGASVLNAELMVDMGIVKS